MRFFFTTIKNKNWRKCIGFYDRIFQSEQTGCCAQITSSGQSRFHCFMLPAVFRSGCLGSRSHHPSLTSSMEREPFFQTLHTKVHEWSLIGETWVIPPSLDHVSRGLKSLEGLSPGYVATLGNRERHDPNPEQPRLSGKDGLHDSVGVHVPEKRRRDAGQDTSCHSSPQLWTSNRGKSGKIMVTP